MLRAELSARLLRRILGAHTAHALTCDACFERMMADFCRQIG